MVHVAVWSENYNSDYNIFFMERIIDNPFFNLQ